MWLVSRNPAADAIEVPAERPDRALLERTGVQLVRGVLGGAEMLAIRAQVKKVVASAFRANRHTAVDPRYPDGQAITGDLLSLDALRSFRYVLLDARIVNVARQLLGNDVVYFGDSGIRVGNGGRGFHQDFVDRALEPTAGGLRFVLYLQDHTASSGGLKVRLGSHRFVSRHFGRMMNVPTELGDLVVFYLRLAHTGHNVRLRAFPELCLHPKLESVIPRQIALPVVPQRLCLLWTFAAPGPHVSRYLGHIAHDPTPWRHCGYSASLVQLAAQQGVTLMKAVPEHGMHTVIAAS
jgi:hypothetical protein